MDLQQQPAHIIIHEKSVYDSVVVDEPQLKIPNRVNQQITLTDFQWMGKGMNPNKKRTCEFINEELLQELDKTRNASKLEDEDRVVHNLKKNYLASFERNSFY
jgi:hypothetical protein